MNKCTSSVHWQLSEKPEDMKVIVINLPKNSVRCRIEMKYTTSRFAAVCAGSRESLPSKHLSITCPSVFTTFNYPSIGNNTVRPIMKYKTVEL